MKRIKKIEQIEDSKEILKENHSPCSREKGGIDGKSNQKYGYVPILAFCLICGPAFILASVNEELFLNYAPLLEKITSIIVISFGCFIIIRRIFYNYKRKNLIFFLYFATMMIRLIIEIINDANNFMKPL